MSLTQEQIKKLLKDLSKLGMENNEKLTNDVNNIVWYMKILDEVDTENVTPTVSVVEKENNLREDIQKENEATPKELLECSPQKVINNQIAVSNIMK